jgi:hypothetical protein
LLLCLEHRSESRGEPTVEFGDSGDQKQILKKGIDSGVTETVFIHTGPNCVAKYTKDANPTSTVNEYFCTQDASIHW